MVSLEKVNFEKFALVSNFGVVKNTVFLGGRLGSITRQFSGLDIVFLGKKLFFRTQSSMLVFTNAIRRSVLGVSRGYYVEISLVGLGYQFLRFGKTILLKVGYSHYIRLEVPASLHVIGFRKKFLIYGVDVDEVNQFTRRIESFKKPDSYKGKGIVTEYAEQSMVLKIGKQK